MLQCPKISIINTSGHWQRCAHPFFNPLVTIIIFLSDPSEIFSVYNIEIWNSTILIYFSRALLTIYKQKSIFSFHNFLFKLIVFLQVRVLNCYTVMS
jgi:hypothetical protein